MTKRGFWSLVEVSNERLERNLKGLIADGCRTEARIVAHLAEMDARKLSLIRGQSLFEYCQTHLGLSDSQAFYRITAARAARRFPVLFDLLDNHHIHLTTITLISKYLTEENHLELLREVRGKSKREVLKLLARQFPKPDVSSHIRKLPPRPGAFAAGPTATLEPLSESTYRLQLNCSETLREKLALAADLMSHSNPTFDLAVVIERAIDLLIDKLQKRRFGQTSRPRSTKQAGAAMTTRSTATTIDKVSEMTSATVSKVVVQTTSEKVAATPVDATPAHVGDVEQAVDAAHSTPPPPPYFGRPKSARARRHISNAIRRQLVERDGLRCTYCGDDGKRCTATAFLQIDHEHAWAKGGSDGLGNLRLLCGLHNRLLAEREFGPRQRKAS